MPFEPCVVHAQPIRWELNPQLGLKTKRCPRCGVILATTQVEKEEKL